jgi:hypothetical protein
MAKATITINSVLGGEATYAGWASKNQYAYGTNVSIEEGDLVPHGITAYDTPTGAPLWLIDNPKDTLIYRYCSDGKIQGVPGDQSAVTALNGGSALSSAAGNGAEYYDNYIYFAKNTQIVRYGPLNGTPAVSSELITNGQLLDGWDGGSDTLLTNTTYPTIGSYAIPNHPMYRHPDDNALYVGDVNGGIGMIHRIATTKVTVEGDTNNGSAFGALDLGYGYFPTAISHYNTELVVAAIDGTGQGRPAKIFFWDRSAVSWSLVLDKELTDPLITALQNVNGTLYVISGSTDKGLGSEYTRISAFAGGYTLRQIDFLNGYLPPFQGATTKLGSKLYFGCDTEVRGCGTVTGLIAQYASTTPYEVGATVTAISTYETPLDSEATLLIGTATPSMVYTSAAGATRTKTLVSQRYKIGQPFQVTKVSMMTSAVAAASITPSITVDNGTTTTSLRAFNSSKFTESEQRYAVYPEGLKGSHDLQLTLTWAEAAFNRVFLPIVIEIETLEDAQE